jgi:hypothetical protein
MARRRRFSSPPGPAACLAGLGLSRRRKAYENKKVGSSNLAVLWYRQPGLRRLACQRRRTGHSQSPARPLRDFATPSECDCNHRTFKNSRARAMLM